MGWKLTRFKEQAFVFGSVKQAIQGRAECEMAEGGPFADVYYERLPNDDSALSGCGEGGSG